VRVETRRLGGMVIFKCNNEGTAFLQTVSEGVLPIISLAWLSLSRDVGLTPGIVGILSPHTYRRM